MNSIKSKIRTISNFPKEGIMFRDITTLLNGENVNMVDVQVRINKNLAELRIVIEVKDIAQLSRMLARIENLPNVLEAQRLRGG